MVEVSDLKVGDALSPTQDFVMDDGDITFYKGVVYTVTEIELHVDPEDCSLAMLNARGHVHYMHNEHLVTFERIK